ncbi:DUF2935 domain-containing protein [Sedimentibacter sp.]|uniref:DUF2935 domain-containing protein n=1 Tax=Sedimentibacter sp. TaxID=1960295 RepID=UPI0028B11EF4|nr:DUF2935 domain-containing protein [Sedimentibacter sp.]
MYTDTNFVRQSLELHLFFARIMKEHSFFLQIGFTPRDIKFTQKADEFRRAFDTLLCDVVALSDGIVSKHVLQSGEVVTPFTLQAERLSEFYTGVDIPTGITKAEETLMGANPNTLSTSFVDEVSRINNRAIQLISDLIMFKATILSNVLECKMFTMNYPLLIDHIMREARLYLSMVEKLQQREFINMEREALEQEAFWNRIMAEHAKFIRGLLDPTEEALFNKANAFGKEFDVLTGEALAAMDRTVPFRKVTEDSLEATIAIRDFKAQGTEGLLNCSIKSIIIPLLGDHTLREANHYLRLLNMFAR